MKRIVLFFMLVCSSFVLCSCAHVHKWVDASCYSPKTCIKCGETEGDIAGHNWISATCINPKTCIECGETEGDAIGHKWTGTVSTATKCANCGELMPLTLPKNGQVFIGKNLNRSSELKIKTSSEACYVKLKGSTGINVFSFFVRANSTATVSVPSGYYYVYFAHGNEWYGEEHLFGDETTYSKDDELLDFKNYSWEYTLTPVSNGNFSETPIDAEEFK